MNQQNTVAREGTLINIACFRDVKEKLIQSSTHKLC